MLNLQGKSADAQIEVTNLGRAPKMCGSVVLQPNIPHLVPVNFVQQFGWDKELKFDFSPFTEMMQTRDAEGRFTFDWWCPLSSIDGYGRHAISIFRGLKLIGVSPILRNDGWGVDHLFLPPDVENANYASRYRLPSKVAAMMTLPYHPFENQSLHQIIVTQFETDHVPSKHIDKVNAFNHLIVTSKFQVDVWKKSGCNIPISVLTPGVDTENFSYHVRPRDGKFKVLIIGALTGRKNPMGAIRIFQHASDGNPDWQLTIKCRPKVDGFAEVEKIAAVDKRIKIVINDTHPDQMVSYYHAHDCMLWPSKGEGCGLPPLEALSTGMEVVCANNSGMRDFVDDDHCYPIKTAGLEPANIPGIGFSAAYEFQFGRVGNWWQPDEWHGVSQLRKCFENWSQGKGKGAKAAEYVRKHHTLRTQAESIAKVLLKYE